MPLGGKQRPIDRLAVVAALALTCLPMQTVAGPINTNAALTPSKGGSILRLQYVYTEADGHGDVRHINTSIIKGTYVYGLRRDLALFLTVPYVHREIDIVKPKIGRIEKSDSGVADLTFLAKYRFWQEDMGPGETRRWAVLGGVNIRSGDSAFTSDSYDPIIGTVFSWRQGRGTFDADLIYQINTGRRRFRHDLLRYDLSYSYRLFPAVFAASDAQSFHLVAELNGRYGTNSSHEVFLSPGMQFATQRWILETSVQLPVIQDIADDEPDTAYRLVIGIRYQW